MNNQFFPEFFNTIYACAFATNSAGTTYGTQLSATPELCIAAGTLILMASGMSKTIENISYEDLLRVWNFDSAVAATARPLWIQKRRTAQWYNLLKFSNGSSLKTIRQHRIFNVEMGAFTYPMTEDTPKSLFTYERLGWKQPTTRRDLETS